MTLTKKDYPDDYSNDYIEVIKALSITKKPVLLGTFSRRGMLYPADVDMNETIRSPYSDQEHTISLFEKQLKQVVRNLLKLDYVIIGDIKAGEKDNKPVRWRANEILKGKKDGFLLKNALTQSALIKFDAVAYLQDVFIEFTMIYQFLDHKGERMNDFKIPTLEESIKKLKKEKNYFKMAKRMYSLKKSSRLVKLFNSNAGSMYQIRSLIDTIIFLLDTKRLSPTDKRIDDELDGLVTRINLLDDKDLEKNPSINIILKKSQSINNKNTLIKQLEKVKDILTTISNKEALRFLRSR